MYGEALLKLSYILVCIMTKHAVNHFLYIQCESKNPPKIFWHFFPKQLGIFGPSLQAYCMFVSTLDYKFLFIYLQL